MNKPTVTTAIRASVYLGVLWFRIRGYGMQFLAPWAKPILHERLRRDEYLHLLGWRIRCLKP